MISAYTKTKFTFYSQSLTALFFVLNQSGFQLTRKVKNRYSQEEALHKEFQKWTKNQLATFVVASISVLSLDDFVYNALVDEWKQRNNFRITSRNCSLRNVA